MACASPISGWFSQKKNPTGKRSIVFTPKEGFADLPVKIPCGKCIQCKAEQSLMWSIRAYHESTLHKQNCFITLTYDEENLPRDGKISKTHVQNFLKRLRKSVYPLKLRYIACGEYGDQTRRPHYHAVLFGTDFLHDKIAISNSLYTSPTLQNAWGLGLVSVAPVTMASIMYVCGYVSKKLDDSDTFALMSRRPGIGHDWLDKYIDDIRRSGCCVINGQELPVPKRYLFWKEDELAQVRKDLKKYALEQDAKFDPVERRRRNDAKEINRKSTLKLKAGKL